MKLILFMLMSLAISCSQSGPNGDQDSSPPKQVLELASITFNISQTAEGISGSLVNESKVNFGDVASGASSTKSIKIFATTNISGLDVSTFSGTNFIQTGTNCGTSLTRNYYCMVHFKFTAPVEEGVISEVLNFNGSDVLFDANVLPPPPPTNPFTFTPNLVDLGDFSGTMLSKSVSIYNNSPSPQDTTMVFPTDPRFNLTHNCPNPLLYRKVCTLTVKFTTTEKPAEDIPIEVEARVQDFPIIIKTLIKGKPRSEDPKFYFNPKPVNFGTINVPSAPVKKTTFLYNYLPATQTNLVPNALPSWLTVRQNCSSVTNNRYCSFEFTLNPAGQYGPLSFDFEMGNDQYFAKLNIQANISGTQPCTLANASTGGVTIDKVTAVNGVVPNCLVTACEAYYNVSANQKSCEIATSTCTIIEATANGVSFLNSNSTVTGQVIGGNISQCLLSNSACNTNFFRNPSGKSCDPVVVSCTTLDATANGVNFSNSNNTIVGNVVGGDVSQCLLSTNACNANYVRNTSGKSCDGEIRACTQVDSVANGVNISNVDLSLEPAFIGQVNTGDVSQCLINNCITGYTKDLTGKICLQNERDCTAADITSIGGNPANALTYSGKVLLGDASACKIATCSGTYEPAVNGLSCENFAMSNLSFVISNKNANGYVKDSFLQLNISATNALEMKISDNNNCSGGNWESFSASKQFPVPDIRLNSGTNSSLSMQFKRGTTTSPCIHVSSGGLTSSLAHIYRHDNIAPILSINSHAEGQTVTLSSISFSGACEEGTDALTGLVSGILISRPCNGTYSSQPLTLSSYGLYYLYIEQTDLAGNKSTLTRTINRVAEPCTTANMSSGGITQSSAVVLSVSGNLPNCIVETCNSNYVKNTATNTCDLSSSVPETISCTVTNGSGVKIWSHTTASYGPCTNIVCDSGYEFNFNKTSCVTEQLAGRRIFMSTLESVFITAASKDGAVKAVGAYFNQVGTGDSNSNLITNTAATVGGGVLKEYSPGYSVSCIINSSDVASCWGGNFGYGEMGTGVTVAYSATPVAIKVTGALSGKKIKKISAGSYHVCVIAGAASDTLTDYAYCWGKNDLGQLGDNSTTNRNEAVLVNRTGVLAGKTIKQIQASNDYTCALASDNRVYCWGSNAAGTLGNASITNFTTVPVAVNDGDAGINSKTVTGISAFDSMFCAHTNSDVMCWGSVFPASSTPSLFLGGLSNLKKISVGSYGALCYLTKAGFAQCYGNGYNMTMSGVSDVGAGGGGKFCVVRSSDNYLFCGGANNMYQLGAGSAYGVGTTNFVQATYFNL